jgi:hypothetical protein
VTFDIYLDPKLDFESLIETGIALGVKSAVKEGVGATVVNVLLGT